MSASELLSALRDDACFQSERLDFRPVEAGDLPLFLELYADAGTMRHVGAAMSEASATQEHQRAVAAWSMQAPSRALYALVERSADRRIGLCGLFDFSSGLEQAEIGVLLLEGSRAAGFGREAARAMLLHAFDRLPLAEVVARGSTLNSGTRAILRSLGFQCLSEHHAEDPAQERKWRVTREMMLPPSVSASERRTLQSLDV